VGCTVYSNPTKGKSRILTQANVDGVVDQVREVLAETFKAALASPIHFQAVPNAFEIFGADLLVTHGLGAAFQVTILELNAEPAIELTGARLGWILDDLFKGVANVCVADFFAPTPSSIESNLTSSKKDWSNGEARHGLVKCLSVEVRGSRAW